uniref:Uncharacterized protein n=1 Tax=Cannabis sativa TaxID=3483 RepID=A0A803Q8Y3_CANSA
MKLSHPSCSPSPPPSVIVDHLLGSRLVVVDAFKDVDCVVVIGRSDSENINALDESVHDLVSTLDSDDELAIGSCEWIVANGINGGIRIGLEKDVGAISGLKREG